MIVSCIRMVHLSPAPAVSASPQPCYRDAKPTYISEPIYPRGYYPDKADVTVRLVIGPDGNLSGGGVLQSSGIAAFDASAIQAAELSRFEPKIVDCKPVTATYLFRVTFRPR